MSLPRPTGGATRCSLRQKRGGHRPMWGKVFGKNYASALAELFLFLRPFSALSLKVFWMLLPLLTRLKRFALLSHFCAQFGLTVHT